MRKNIGKDELTCSFCGRHASHVEKMISGPDVQICSECVRACNDIVRESRSIEMPEIDFAIPDPEEISINSPARASWKYILVAAPAAA